MRNTLTPNPKAAALFNKSSSTLSFRKTLLRIPRNSTTTSHTHKNTYTNTHASTHTHTHTHTHRGSNRDYCHGSLTLYWYTILLLCYISINNVSIIYFIIDNTISNEPFSPISQPFPRNLQQKHLVSESGYFPRS